ncbi:hypothetical protein [Acetobacter pasteurianus]|uniref:Uncharacterized protein n=1 Tax=Acetobacter pasteurianus NBRC 3188 TaxID=1226663 RepID=A0A401WRR4_ACEPA|nr:hypothetical protein [Acetobacter pasteurianus]GCD52019.1 hypothetical protein NBRC3188_0716 [Acetobacter pasteurianus NBRC 3188]
MSNDETDYKKSLSDELDFNSIDQYHESIMQISNQCFEYKKLCVGAIGIIIAAMLKIKSQGTLILVPLICIFVTIGFWMCDSTAYYYQRANRQKLSFIQNQISSRNKQGDYNSVEIKNSVSGSIFNRSMILYMYFVIILFLFLLIEVIAKIIYCCVQK